MSCVMDSGDLSTELKVALDTAPWRKRSSSSASGSPKLTSSASPVVQKGAGKRVSFDIPPKDEPLDDDSEGSTVDTVKTDGIGVPLDGDADQQLEQWYVQVAIGNIPAKLLVDVTMQAMLEQTVTENALISFKMHRGTSSGSATAFFAGVQDAQFCVNHFNGRRWDRNASPVTAEIVSMPWVAPLPPVDPMQAQIAKLLEEAAMHMHISQMCASNAAIVAEVKEPQRSKSAVNTQKMNAPRKIPVRGNAGVADLSFLKSESPAFICMAGAVKQTFTSSSEISNASSESGDPAFICIAGAVKQTCRSSSEISTESGESGESENEESTLSEIEEEAASMH